MVPIDTNGDPGARTADGHTVSALEYYSTGVLSLVASLLVLALVYGPVVRLASPLHVLSTTAVVALFLALWAATWLAFELLWDWQSERLTKA